MPIVVAVLGASGSGKSSLLNKLIQDPRGLGLSLVRVDDYYRDLSDLAFEVREAVNFDHPSAIEFERLQTDLTALKRGQSIECPCYDFTQHTRTALTHPIASSDIIILEGVLALADASAAALVDRIVFIDTPLDLCLSRRIERDARERDRTEASVRDFWETRALPMFDEFVRPWRERADLVLRGDRDAQAAHERLVVWLDRFV